MFIKTLNYSMLIIFLCNADEIERRILGGTKVNTGELPFVAGVGYMVFSEQLVAPLCGAAIINARHLVSAAHCTADPHVAGGGRFMVMVGSATADVDEGTWYRVEKFFVTLKEEQYGPPVDDIAVIRIWGEFDFDENVQPASLSTTHETPLGDAIVCGWGHYVQKPKKRSSRDLLKVKMTVVNPSKCVSAWSKFNVDYNICAESPVSTGTCNGDSGGPLIIGNTVHGLLSYGHGKCGNGVPEVYTSVGVFYKWIQGIAGL